MPYRSGGEEEHLSQEGSVVDELVRQFADPYAFLRELIQNGLDAKATRLVVRMDRVDGGRCSWSVEDDGVGMTLAVVEGPLLTAFSSSKEGHDGGETIGKYGVGFLSVFGLAPSEVRVTTWRAEGTLEVRLFPDHSYELRELARREGHGTVVAVEHPVRGDSIETHEERGEAALLRWCRHAARPIELDRPTRNGRRTVRIDRPLSLDAPVVVSAEADGITVLVGPAAGTDRLRSPSSTTEGRGAFAGFYNRGLTLFETTDPSHVVPGVRFKASGKTLRHTLSRDDVKRDRDHARALDLVKSVAAGAMREELAKATRLAAEVVSSTGQPGAYDALLAAAWELLPKGRVVVPLLPSASGGARIASTEALTGEAPLLVTRHPDGPARALAARGAEVVRLPDDDRAAEGLAKDLAAMTGRAIRFADELATRLVPAGTTSLGDAAGDLAPALVAALRAAGQGVADVRFAVTEGRPLPGASVFVPGNEALPLVGLPEHFTSFQALPHRGRALVLFADRDVVRTAVRLADADARMAAAFLARLILLEHGGALSEEAADALLLVASEDGLPSAAAGGGA